MIEYKKDQQKRTDKEPPHIMIDEIRGFKLTLHYIFILLFLILFLWGLIRFVVFIISLYN